MTPLPAGSQVVALVPVRGSQSALVHPRGAVGIVTRTPAVPGERWLVRFPDGFEATFERAELELLKTWKEPGAPPEDFRFEEHIVFECVVGSRAYGLETEASDTDRRGVYQAPSRLLFSLYGAPEQFEDHAAQTCHWELRKFLVMALKANPNVLECLYSPLVTRADAVGEALRARRALFLSQLVFQTFNGYALSQFKLIERDQRNAGGIRWKHAMHLLRLLLSGLHAVEHGELEVRVEGSERERLLAVKRGEIPWSEVERWRRELHARFEQALTTTPLPERPDYEGANALLLEARGRKG
ncbi:MAG: nucleotidyltransferase domain-containing protein [Verrucomicrobia bacterium]|nr:nucleotidyltransferase domain-containing protein [Verrucomicrobiota bacterium]